MDSKELIAFAEALADTSANVIVPYFRAGIGVEYKADESPVTKADKEAEAVMRKLIEETYPDHGIMGEEHGYVGTDAEYCWTLDPIDGTVSFIAGRPTFGTLIGLLHKGKPILGIINQPISGERWIGSELGATFNGKPCKVDESKVLEEAFIATSGPQYFVPVAQAAYSEVAATAKNQIYGGDCYGYGLLALGYIDIVIEAGLKPHDFVPLAAIVEAAGGVCKDWDGNAITMETDGDIIAASTLDLAEEARALLLEHIAAGEMFYSEFEDLLAEEKDEFDDE